MNLTQGEYDVLCAYMSGLSNIEIAKLLNVNRTTIWRRRKIIQQKININITNQLIVNNIKLRS